MAVLDWFQTRSEHLSQVRGQTCVHSSASRCAGRACYLSLDLQLQWEMRCQGWSNVLRRSAASAGWRSFSSFIEGGRRGAGVGGARAWVIPRPSLHNEVFCKKALQRYIQHTDGIRLLIITSMLLHINGILYFCYPSIHFQHPDYVIPETWETLPNCFL